jgi:hypothetical protein
LAAGILDGFKRVWYKLSVRKPWIFAGNRRVQIDVYPTGLELIEKTFRADGSGNNRPKEA